MKQKHTRESSGSISTMYPRVRVREPDDSAPEMDGLFKSLSLEDSNHRFPAISFWDSGNDYQSDSPPSHARVPKTYIPILPTPSISISTGNCNKETDVESKPYVRAGFVPRPRAILSSPNNDGRKLRSGNQSSKKHRSSCHIVDIPTKMNLKNAQQSNSPVKTSTKAIDGAHNQINPNQKHVRETPRQRTHITRSKQNTVGNRP